VSGGDTDLVYDFTGIDSVSSSIDAFVAKMNAHLDEVDMAVIGLLEDGWQGLTADVFDAHSKAWHDSAYDLAKALYDLGRKVGNATVNMQMADIKASGRF
jgi:WXG100 family type VII secretion target